MGAGSVRFTLTENWLPGGNSVVLVMLELLKSGFQTSNVVDGVLRESVVVILLSRLGRKIEPCEKVATRITSASVLAKANGFKQVAEL